MQVVPEWAPNIHPLFVHLPIALLTTAVLVDVLALLIRPWQWLRPSAVLLYVLGSLSGVLSYITGQRAADTVTLPAQGQIVLTDHADWALYTLIFFGVYTLIRLAVIIFVSRDPLALRVPLLLLALPGLYLVWQTGDHGGQLVFEHGAGVRAAAEQHGQNHTEHAETAADTSAATPETAAGLVRSEDGGWQWHAGPGAAEALQADFRWVAGSPGQVAPSMEQHDGRTALALHLSDATAMLTAEGSLSSIQATAVLNLEAFEGTAMIVHHVQDARNYDFLAVEDSLMRLGRMQDGRQTLFSEQQRFERGGWLSLRVISDKTHFRGYAGKQLVVHGHGDAPAAGPVGLRFEGSGTVMIGSMQVEVLR